MIKIFVDSGSSIKQSEKDKYGVEIIPLKLSLAGTEYADGIDLTSDVFYDALINKKLFPRTSLPSLGETEDAVMSWVSKGYDVMIITISSEISGTYNAFTALFADEPRVKVIDSKSAVGGVRILVGEANKHLDKSLDEVAEILYALIPRIKVVAIPETLEYLHRGGRLSRSAFVVGTLLQIKPLITLDSADGKVKVLGKERGKRRAMTALVRSLDELECDEAYPIIPSYTCGSENLDELISMTDRKYLAQMTDYDDLDHAIACHWGPNAFGYIFVAKN